MAKLGRNDPCRCGSGKKYKKCHLRQDEEAVRAAPAPPFGWEWEEDPLDELSNRVVDLIEAGDLDGAEALCDRLDTEYPYMIDPLERRAMVLEARGRANEAADFYRKAAVYARRNDGFDPETIRFYEEKARQLAASTNPQ